MFICQIFYLINPYWPINQLWYSCAFMVFPVGNTHRLFHSLRCTALKVTCQRGCAWDSHRSLENHHTLILLLIQNALDLYVSPVKPIRIAMTPLGCETWPAIGWSPANRRPCLTTQWQTHNHPAETEQQSSTTIPCHFNWGNILLPQFRPDLSCFQDRTRHTSATAWV